MISDKSLHISTLKNVMCDILQAKMLSVIFRQQKNGVYWSVNIFMCVDSTYFPKFFWVHRKGGIYLLCTSHQGSSPAIWWERITRQKMFPPLKNQPFN
jgi:hypothetical protein